MLARAVRRLPAPERVNESPTPPPGVVLVGRGDVVETISHSAKLWLDRILPASRLPPHVWSVVGAARRAARDPSAPDPMCRVRAASGWIILHASVLDDDPDGRVSVVVQGGGDDLLLPMFAASYGLTSRELDVLARLREGRATKEIAANLRLSAHTVNDHLKAIFRKVGVSGRQELLAALRG